MTDITRALHVERRGRHGPHVVFIHGFGGNTQTWSPWVSDLAADHQLHLVDVKGFGNAPRPRDGRYSPIDLARPVLAYIREQGLTGATLIGHSLGGAIALIIALELQEETSPDGSPRRLARLVIVAGAAFPQSVPPFIRLAGSRAIGGVFLRIVPMRWLIRKALEKVYFDPSTIRSEQISAYADPISRPGGRYAVRTAAKQLVPPDADRIIEGYGSLDVPTLLLWGRHDEVVPLETAHRLEAVLPRCELHILERCGHIPSEELPEDSLAIVRKFFAEAPVSGDAPARG